MNLQLKKVTSVLLLGILVLSLAPAIIAYMPAKTQALATDYVILEGAFPECCTDSVQYSYKVNTWATGAIFNYSDLAREATGPNDPNQGPWSPEDTWYNASKVLRIALTEYGEFAGNDSANVNHVGIAYGANYAEWENTESWASEAINEGAWVQGWLLWVNYTYWLGPTQYPRALLAWAEYSDGLTTEAGRGVYDWDSRYNSSETSVNTIIAGFIHTSGLQVLYDSARLGVVRTSVYIHDSHLNIDFAKITFTVILDKCGKVATVFKDVKFLFGKGFIINDWAFSERYELDLAAKVNPNLESFIHYFDYQELIDTKDSLGLSAYYHPELGTNGYDIVQAYDVNKKYVWAAAYWPNATEFDVFTNLVPSIVGGTTTVLPNDWRQADFMGGAEPEEPWVPFISVQWRYNRTYYPELCNFLATPGTGREIRFVEVLTMTDYNSDAPHPALDFNDTEVINQVDAEVAYQVDYEIFNPEDLNTVDHDFWWANNEEPFCYSTSEDYGPFMYTVVGSTASTVDDLGAAFLAANYKGWRFSSLPILDKAFTLEGTIPYALDNFTATEGGASYLGTYNSVTAGIGKDPTTFYYVAMKEFAFDYYSGYWDDVAEEFVSPQPIKGGLGAPEGDQLDVFHFYPSINPLSERWSYNETLDEWDHDMYIGPEGINYDPNGMITVGGPKANWVTRYFNDYMYAITREGTVTGFKYFAWISDGSVYGSAPTSDPAKTTLDFFPLSSWNTSATTWNYQAGYAVIALGRDESGLRGLAVYGWDARDTYWASEWAAKFILGESGSDFPEGTVALIIHITYTTTNREPTSFEVVQMLGTITQFGANPYIDKGFDWDHGPYAGDAEGSWYDDDLGPVNHLGTWCYPWVEDDVWWFKKFPTIDETTLELDP